MILPFTLEHPLPALLINSEDQAFHVELGDTIADNINHASLSLMDPQSYTCYYAHYFAGRDPYIFLSWDEEGRPLFISIEKKSTDEMDGDAEALGQINLRVLIRSSRPPNKDTDVDDWSIMLVPRQTASSTKLIKKYLSIEFPLLKGSTFVDVTAPGTDAKLLALEEKLVISRYKFAVMYLSLIHISDPTRLGMIS